MQTIRDFMAVAPDAMLLVAADGRIVHANALAEELFGYAPGGLTKTPVEALLPERFRNVHLAHRRDFLTNPRTRAVGIGPQLHALHRDGREIPVEINLSPMAQAGGVETLVAIRDVSERRRIERALADSERQLGMLVSGVTDYAIYMLDAKGTVVTWNSGAARIKGYSAEEIVGRHYSVFFTDEDCAAGEPAKALAAATAQGRFEKQAWRVRKDGSRFLAHVVIDTVRDEAGALAGFVKIARDITGEKRAEEARNEARRQAAIAEERRRSAEALRRSNEALASVLEASPVGIVATGPDGVIESWNKAAEQIYGCYAAEAIGRRQAEVMEGDGSAGRPRGELIALASRGGTRRGVELRHRRHDGQPVEVSVSSAPLFGAQGEPRGFVFVIDDITQRKALAEQLRHSQKLETMGQLTGGVAHDFNNLLGIVISNLELLQEGLQPGGRAWELCDAAMGAGLRGAELIAHMLAFARKQSLEPKLLKVNDLVRNMAKLLGRTLGTHIEIELKLDPETWPVLIDPVQFETALTNLATNARDAMPQGGHLSIQTANVVLDDSYTARFSDVSPGRYMMVAVTDSGTGMTQEVVDQAFDPFFTTKAVGQGTGLGLSMVFGFVKQSGGHIRIYSEVGAGTTVKLYLPHSALEGPGQVRTPYAAQPPTAGHESILVVEDNEALAQSVGALLAAAGFVPILAHDGHAALALLARRDEIDLLFTDIVMPGGLNGVELARRALNLRPGLKVLFTSGFADAFVAPGDSVMIANRLLTKPYRREELIAKIHEVLQAAV
ncbi:MAG: PAS domain S-box protein [Nevskia sp.]|nr:PAS domain S-box protein [Nevskia sp.]